MWEQLIPQLVGTVAPIILGIIKDHRAATGHDPTPEEVVATFTANLAKYLGEGEAWKAAHPEG